MQKSANQVNSIPNSGTYILFIRLSKDITLKIGRLGNLTFRKGIYAYIGSAKKRLLGRLSRHIKKKKRLFWHIDYLLFSKYVAIAKILITKPNIECRLARVFKANAESVKDFGSSDCKCPSHLFWINKW